MFIPRLLGRRIRRLARKDEAATMLEYALMAGLIAAVCVAAVAALGGTVDGLFATGPAAF